MTGGSGTGDYPAGTTLAVTAQTPDNMTFVRWEAQGIEISGTTQETLVFTMPANAAELTAVFEPATQKTFVLTAILS